MMGDITFEINIPSDGDGYVLLQCEHCGTLFKITVDDTEDERLLNIFCPCCGLISENYLTEEVVAIAQTVAQNHAMDMIHAMFKDLERKTRNNTVEFKAGKKPKHEYEGQVRAGIEALVNATFDCCSRTAKVKPLLKMTGCYCPFCGVKNYEIK